MQLTVFNLTEDVLSFMQDRGKPGLALLPNSSAGVSQSGHRFLLSTWDPSLLGSCSTIGEKSPFALNERHQQQFSVRIRRAVCTSWQPAKVSEDCPWRIYRRRVRAMLCYHSM